MTTPRELQRASYEEARRLGTSYIGPDHALVAILRTAPDGAAGRALARAGMTLELAEQAIDARGEASESVVHNPAWQKVEGRAEGLAYAAGVEPRAEHFVVAMLWDEHRWMRWDAQVPRASVIAALEAEGCELPKSPLLPFDETHFTQRVELASADLDGVLRELSRLHEKGGPRFGFNTDGAGNAFVIAEDGIDLAAVVREVTSGSR